MKIHHLVHGSNHSQDLSASSEVQGTSSTTNSFQEVDSYTSNFPISSNKYKSSEMPLDQVSSHDFRKTADIDVSASTQYQIDNVNDEFPLSGGDNNKISPVTNSLSPVPDLLLANSDLWSQFYRVDNEMIITKAGRCIFPLLKFNPVNLDPTVNYSFIVDFVQVSKNRFRFKKGNWISVGPDKRKFLSNYSACGTVHGNPFTHPDSPQSGAYWMNFGVSFPKIKLTNRLRQTPLSSGTKKRRQCGSASNNDSSLPPGHFYLTSFHKYWPRVKMIKHAVDEDQESFFTFEETTFIAVTHYQNEAVNILKKSNNPHAKGFKEPFKDPCNSESEKNSAIIESEIDDNEVDIEEINDSVEKNNFSSFNSTLNQSNNSNSLEEKIRQWRENVDIETNPMSIDDPSSSPDDVVFHTSQTNLYQNMGGFRTKVVKKGHYTSEKQLASHYHPLSSDVGTRETNSRPISPVLIPSKDFGFSNFRYYSSTNSTYDYNPVTKRQKLELDRSISFPKVLQQDNKQEETPSQLNSRQQFQQQQNTQHSILNKRSYCSAPVTPLSPGNIFLSTISNNKSSNIGNLNSYFRLENENKRLREFIRERYGIEAEKEADAVVVLGGKEI